MQTTVTTESFIAKAKKVHNNKYDYSKVEYRKSSQNVCIICPKHGEFWQTPNNHLSGKGCRFCSQEKCAQNYRKGKDVFIAESMKIHKNKYDYSQVEYINNKHKVCIICPAHGSFWQTPSGHLKGQGCPRCGIEQSVLTKKLELSDFIKRANSVHECKYDYSHVQYKNIDTKIKIICPQHGMFLQKPYHHLNGCGCPKCKSSMLENIIRYMLSEHKIEFIEQKKFLWLKSIKLMSLDFYLPQYNIAIECQGGQHFKPGHFSNIKDDGESIKNFYNQIERDELKYQLCQKHGITILYFAQGNVSDDFIKKHQYYTNTTELLTEIKKRA